MGNATQVASKWFKSTSQFNNDFIKSCKENTDEGYFLQVDIQYP